MGLLGTLASIALPCYAANATPVLVARLVGRTHPLDMGRRFLDGRRLLGDGKSVEGFLSGVAAGILAGWLLGVDTGKAFVLSLGSMLGDSLGSFIKRRLGLRRGDPAPLIDQLTFLAVALALYQGVYADLSTVAAALLLAATPPIHLAANYVAYKLGLKDRPW